MENLVKMTKSEKVEWFVNNCDVKLLSSALGISVEAVIESFCGDDYTFSKLFNSKKYTK